MHDHPGYTSAPLQRPSGEIIRNHHTVKTPLFSQNICKQVFVDVRRHSPQLIIGSHYIHGTAFLDGGFERGKENIPATNKPNFTIFIMIT